MAQALSEEEFHRMQAQLLELRTQNYQLSDDLRKNSSELNTVRQKNVVLERDFVKAQKALNKSKKAQEVEALLSENEMLQGKLHSQEEDFRLQNSTLMTELSKLCTQIEQLEQENQGLKEGGVAAPSSPSPSPDDGELLRLKAENLALLKKMKAHQDEVIKSVATETDGSAGANGVSEVIGKGEEPGAEGTNEKLEQTEAQLQLTEKQMHELEMRRTTEQEEKRLLREQLHGLEASRLAETTKLQEEVTKLSDKLKKKQESFQRLQGEKEALYNDSRTKIDEINQRKEDDLKATNIRIQKLQSDMMAANQATAELREKMQSKEREHELAVLTLKDQVANQSAVSQEQVDNILQENDALRTNLAALEQIQTVKTQEGNLLREQQEALTLELLQRRAEQEKHLVEKEELETQLQVSDTHTHTHTQVTHTHTHTHTQVPDTHTHTQVTHTRR
ncbi:GRIP1-associated protein 1 [Liparis tanakae]|uniref:GRIP1-associated protein 1 n=1 Tax=Liparis tanakae TaxID=230148 RepID=A0A4Z2FCT3_9TELE|nr:GRIP1-associated protein 1 [Liparis tanakae]